MLRLPPFQYHTPSALEEALALIADLGPEARLVAGGTDLYPNMKRRTQLASHVVNLLAINPLRAIERRGEWLTVGSTALLEEVARHPEVRHLFPALATAVASISSPPLRQMGTLGGNLCVDTRCTYYNQTEEWRRAISYCMKECGETCWVAPSSSRCLAHTASDAAPILCALGAEVVLASRSGQRTIPLHDLYQDDGISYLSKTPDEILTEIRIPLSSSRNHCRSAFWKLRRRGSIDFAVLSSSVALWLDDQGAVRDAAIYLGAVSSSPLAATKAVDLLQGKQPTEDLLAEAAALARKLATPFDNTDFQAQWRALMVERYTEAALRDAVGLPQSLQAPRHVRIS